MFDSKWENLNPILINKFSANAGIKNLAQFSKQAELFPIETARILLANEVLRRAALGNVERVLKSYRIARRPGFLYLST